MNDVLLQIKELLETNLTKPYNVGRVEVGNFTNSYVLARFSDYPAIWIEPLDEDISYSNWANNLIKLYSVRIYTIMFSKNVKTTQIQLGTVNQGKTLNEFTNEIIRLLGSNKLLNGKVRLQSPDFKLDNFFDQQGREVKSIRVKYKDDLIPYASQTLDQNDMIKQI
jgi:hypothetical protein